MELAGAAEAGYVVLAGRYEGVDERFVAEEVDEEIAIGDFVVSGGELPALMLIDAIARQLPGALNDAESAQQDSFVDGLLDCPHYTRPEAWAAWQCRRCCCRATMPISGGGASRSAGTDVGAAARPAGGPCADARKKRTLLAE